MSRLIKSQWTSALQNDKKVISIKSFENSPSGEDLNPSVKTEIKAKTLLMDARTEAEAILNAAKAEEKRLYEQINEQRQAFETERTAVLEEARQTGFAKGLEEGKKIGFEEFHETIQFAKGIIESARSDYRSQVDSSEKTILDLGIKTASRILGSIIDENKENFLPIVKRALKEAREYQEIQLHIHPVQYDLLLSHKEELIMLFPRETDFYIYPDDELSEESCIIESANGRIDASIDTQLEEIKRRLYELLESEQ